MPLALAIKNKTGLVVASDSHDADVTVSARYSQLMLLPNRCVLMVVGNHEAIRHAIVDVALPKVTADIGAAAVAQLVQAALVLEVIPKLPQITGRVELIVAGIDPIRHTQQPGLYYLDSAQDFYLTLITEDVVAAGSTAVITQLTRNRNYSDSSADELLSLAKECFASTKLRWPTAVAGHVTFGLISPEGAKFQTV